MSIIYVHAPACYLRPLQVLQNRCLKIIFNLDRLTPTITLYSEHARSILPLRGIQYISTCKFVKQCLTNNIHHTIFFQQRDLNRQLRNPRKLYCAAIRNEYGRRRVAHFGPSCFNELPPEITEARSLPNFIHKLKNYVSSPDYLQRFLR